MKQLIVIVGPNAVGKSTTAEKIVELCPQSAFIDSEWCRVMNPFPLTDVTKVTVIENMYSLLRNYDRVKALYFDIRRILSGLGENNPITDNLHPLVNVTMSYLVTLFDEKEEPDEMVWGMAQNSIEHVFEKVRDDAVVLLK